jgi:hypothetical protein
MLYVIFNKFSDAVKSTQFHLHTALHDTHTVLNHKTIGWHHTQALISVSRSHVRK